MARHESACISKRLTDFRQRRNPRDLLTALWLVAMQGRWVELLFGLYCTIRFRPSRVENSRNIDVDELIHHGEHQCRVRSFQRHEAIAATNAMTRSNEGLPHCRIHGVAECEAHTFLGEYAENSARVYVRSPDRVRIFSPYDRDARVRHIHMVHAHNGVIYIATGDSRKYLDQFTYGEGKLQRISRVVRWFGGFTAGCSIGQKLYLGTDFSGRPNYIYCLETRERFPFPRPAFFKYCAVMLPIEDRYIICVNRSLPYAAPQRVISIFDVVERQFIFSEICMQEAFAVD